MPKVSVAAASGDGFRTDINGLRAWAVVAVVLFHFGVPGFSGGFVGVDVFFVISGFLMAGIVTGGLERGHFSLPGFYIARARRIVPALLVLVLAVLLLGWFILTPEDYRVLGAHARESLLFTSNLRYLSESGYFDTASHEKWLLHTWSLSVEWQFYLAYPLVLMALQRWMPGRRALLQAHLLVLALSFACSLWLVVDQPARAFFLLPSRAWELLVGGLVFLAGGQLSLTAAGRCRLEWAGLGLILLAICAVDDGLPWPGALALLPTLGATLVLLANRPASLWTASLPAQWLGTRSYSIYLWHWPLMVWLTYFDHQHQVLWVTAAILLALLLGHLSFRGVELPVRRWLNRGSNLRSLGWLLAGLLLMVLSAQQVRRSGYPERMPEAVASIEAERHNVQPRQQECMSLDNHCVFGGEQIAALVIGDSHADSLVTAVAAALPQPSSQGVYFRAQSGCLLLDGARALREEAGCERLRGEFAALESLHPGTPVILINRLTMYLTGDDGRVDAGRSRMGPRLYFSQRYAQAEPALLEEFRQHYLQTVCRISRSHPLYVVMPLPEMPRPVPQAMSRALLRGLPKEIRIARSEYHARHDFVRSVLYEAAERCGVTLLDPLEQLCDERYCHGERDGMPLYLDSDHLSERGNRLLVPMFARVFARSAVASQSLAPAP